MTTHSIPVDSITTAVHTLPPASNPGDRLPVIEVLAEIASSMSSDANTDQMLMRFLEIMVRISQARAGAVRVLTADGEHLRMIGSIGLTQSLLDRERFVPLDCGICGQATLTQSTQYDSVLQVCQKQVRHIYTSLKCNTVYAVPLRHKGKVLGVYNLFMEEPQPLSEDIRYLFNSISEQLGMALENARLTRENMRISLTNERTMLANQIHDSLAQTLAYAKMRLTVLNEALSDNDQDRANRYLGDVEEAVDMAYSELRNLITQFRDRIDPRGLVPALQEMVESFRKKANADVDFLNVAQDVVLTPDEEIQVFHIIQEALYNICKHARARHVVVTLDLHESEYVVNVADDGVGLRTGGASNMGKSFGLTIMRERAAKLNGTLSIESRAAGGTIVRLVFPSHHGVEEQT
ncbi:MAG: histidine kinase [Pseudomonadota bacterium]|nr:histidine kinase [Pseudomonadota bacterium]MDP1904245.1 histidine kinase [Pseudomonadota bacterium]MDP2354403.1 histidine kinase [Pseudomonadota bacterium]